MNMRNSESEGVLLRLLAALCDQTITDAEMEQFEQLLARDRDARRTYIHYMDLHAELQDRYEFQAAGEDSRPMPAFAPKSQPLLRYAVAGLVLLAATVSIAAVVVLVRDNRAPVVAEPAPRPLEVPESQPIAAITQLDGVRWDDSDVPTEKGAELYPGTMKILAGQVRIEFYCGASVLLEGPAEFRLINDSRGHLVRGKMAAVVPEEAVGFVVSAPRVAVVDFGTEFGLNVDENGKSEIHVFDGEVEASLLGDDGATLTSTRLVTGEAVEIDSKKAKIARVKARKERFIRVKPLKFAPLDVSPNYVKAVMASEPLGFWRFEKMTRGTVPNHAGDGFKATVPSGVKIRGKDNHVAMFRNVDPGGCVVVDDPLAGLNSGNFTLEFWVNPHVVKGAVLAGLMVQEPEQITTPGDKPAAVRYLLLVRLCHKSKKLLYPTGALQVVYRWPAGKGGGTNVFSKKACTPGRWHHVVVVRRQTQLTLYLNGKKVRTVPVNVGADPQLYQLFAGRYPAQTSKQRFKGDLDELAIYPRALSAKEIRRHYTLVRPPKPRRPAF